MKILYVAMKYDYGRREQGYSFEHYNFFDSLSHLGHEIVYFDFMSLVEELGRDGMNRRLLEVAKAERPDLMFTVMFLDEFDPAVVRKISAMPDTVTLNWFTDDHWRFETFTRQWASTFNWAVTTASSALPKYDAMGFRNVIKSQWACNPFLYRKLDLPLKWDVTFVGQPHGDRPETIRYLRDAGIDVRVWGRRWESGRISQDEMIRVFNQSRINLNLSNASRPVLHPPTRVERARDSIERHAFGRVAKRPLRPLVNAARRRRPDVGTAAAPRVLPDQIKGRNFEVPGCGGFLLTGNAQELDRYYEPGREIACFESREELLAKVVHYLERDDERAEIADAGLRRTLRDHTYSARLGEIFERIGLRAEGERADGRPGSVLEISL
jgi:spore maturation protein CgeB